MAKFDIPGNYDNVTSAFFNDAAAHFSDPIDFRKGSNEIFIYTNYPEYLNESHLGDGDTPRYINKVEVTGKQKVLIYLTHHLEDLEERDYTLGIRVYNPTSRTITFTRQHEGYSNTNSWDNPGYAWEDFFATKKATIPVPSNDSVWLTTKSITQTHNMSGSFLDYFGEYTVDGSFLIAVYVCKNINNIPDLTHVIDWPGAPTYSGYSDCYSLTGSKTLDMADALVSYRNSFFFGISNPMRSFPYNPSENVPVHLVQGGTLNVDNPDDNVGNYGLKYNLKFTFKNTSSTPVKVKAYLIGNNSSHFAGLASLDGCSKFLKTEYAQPGDSNRWNFYTSDTITNSSGSVTIDFSYCHLALGSRGAILQFEAVPV